ncbi:MAG: ATP-binding cassette domain-containing protein [Agathobacter sp.]|nr:ATP-binding cassette domain-containing protein [Agathobacter sp.]
MELKLENIRKSYNQGKTYAVDDFSMDFKPGIYGLLGPNGAGKSTLINMITNNLEPDEGNISFDGKAITELGAVFRACIGYMPQQQALYDEFTGEQFLWYMAALKGLKKKEAGQIIESALQIVNLSDARYKKLKAYSGGMKQRILIAQALLNNPDVLILDEPTAGLDPKERIRIRNYISEISKDKIVLLATHVVSDIEFIAKQIIIMKDGKILRNGTPQSLIAEMRDKVFEVFVTEEEHVKCQELGYNIANIMFTEEGICLRVVADEKPRIGKVQETRPTLEDVYLYLIR